MSDLISRSRVIENIWDVFNSYANDSLRFDEYETEAINRAFTVLQKTIEGQPTAYNPEKVVEELKEKRGKWKAQLQENDTNFLDNEILKQYVKHYDKAIDIVKRGGVE